MWSHFSSHCVSTEPPAHIPARWWLGAGFSAQLDTPPGQLHDPLSALLFYAHAYRASRTGAVPPCSHRAHGDWWSSAVGPALHVREYDRWVEEPVTSQSPTRAWQYNDSPIILAGVQLFTSNDLCQQSLWLGGKGMFNWCFLHTLARTSSPFLCMWT